MAPASSIATAIVAGRASFVDPSFGPGYLALPQGRRIAVTICRASVCIDRISNDAGPDQRVFPDRVADLSFADFGLLCGCDPWRIGLINVTVEFAQ